MRRGAISKAALGPARSEPQRSRRPALRPISGEAPRAEAVVEAVVDGERIRLRASQELTIECGKARITLTAAGKILIEGAYVSSRSTGVNRLRGGTVEIN